MAGKQQHFSTKLWHFPISYSHYGTISLNSLILLLPFSSVIPQDTFYFRGASSSADEQVWYFSESRIYFNNMGTTREKAPACSSITWSTEHSPGLGIRTDSPQFNCSEAPNVPSSSQSVKMGSSFYRSVTKVILTTDFCPEYSAGYLV